MKCTYCKTEFEIWEHETDCSNCDDGEEEYQHDYMMEPGYRTCRTCKGTGLITSHVTDFCSDYCMEEYWYEQRFKNEQF